jgi:SAM-dependent methyltransferase
MQASPDFSRDRRGWFYRALAPDADCRVLEVGNAFADNWFSDVARCDRLDQTAPQDESRPFDIVLLHNSLGGCATLKAAIESARRLLRIGGLLVVAGENCLPFARRAAGARKSAPRATGWGFRAQMTAGGFGRVALYTVHPDSVAPVHVVHAHRASSRAFFRSAFSARERSRLSPRRLARALMIELNAMPYLQPDFVVVGEKC